MFEHVRVAPFHCVLAIHVPMVLSLLAFLFPGLLGLAVIMPTRTTPWAHVWPIHSGKAPPSHAQTSTTALLTPARTEEFARMVSMTIPVHVPANSQANHAIQRWQPR